jgi:CBS domain-containing protein
MSATFQLPQALTAQDVMNRHIVLVPLQMRVREAVRLIHEGRTSEAVVVDEKGQCVGMVSAADVVQWVAAGCPEAVLSLGGTCPYRVQGRLLTGGDGVICVLSHGCCPYQMNQPGTAGRHMEICTRPAGEPSPFATGPTYVTTSVVTTKSQTPLSEVARQVVDARTDRLIVVNEFDQPIGIVTAAAVLNAVESSGKSGSGDPVTQAK